MVAVVQVVLTPVIYRMFFVVDMHFCFELYRMTMHFFPNIGMNQNELASLFSSVGGGAPGLMQGSHRGKVLSNGSSQPIESLLDAFSQQTPDSRPNTAPAGTRTTGATASGGTTSASGVRPTGTSSSSSSKPRNGGTSSSPATTVPSTGATGASSGTTIGPKGGPIQMSALSNVLANLSANNPSQGASGADGAAAKPAIDLYDIMNSEVRRILQEERENVRLMVCVEFNSHFK